MKYILGFILIVSVFGAAFYIRGGDSGIKLVQEPPKREAVETVNVSRKAGEKVNIPLKLTSGFEVGVFAKNIDRARNLEVSPEGTVLVSSFDKITALKDSDNNGQAEAKVILDGLNKTHGFAFFKDKLFVTEEIKVTRYIWDEQNLEATLDEDLFPLPKGGSHFTRTIVFDNEGIMYISLGSSCNVCVEKEPFLASVVVSDSEGVEPKLYASGLRNSVALAINPKTGELWGADNGRDLIGDKLPPEEVNIIKQGLNYGWPDCYGDKVHDVNFDPDGPADKCRDTKPSIYGMGAHMAPLGMEFIPKEFNPDWEGDLIVALHGSWNSSKPVGYKVLKLKVEGNSIKGEEDFLAGFLQGIEALGRPVDLVFDKKGSLYISDDKAGVVYKVVKK